MKKMRKCALCGSYTLKELHCGEKTKSAHPAKYSYAKKGAEYEGKHHN